MKEWPCRCSDYFVDEICRNKFETIKIWRISSNLPRCCNSSLVRPKAMLGLVWPYEIRHKYRNTYTASNAFSSPVPLGLQRKRLHGKPPKIVSTRTLWERIFPFGREAPEEKTNRARRENCQSIVHGQRSEDLTLHYTTSSIVYNRSSGLGGHISGTMWL